MPPEHRPVVVNVTLTFESHRTPEVAKSLQARLPDPQWQAVRALAAEIVALGESQAAGERILVVPARELDSVAKHLRVAPKA